MYAMVNQYSTSGVLLQSEHVSGAENGAELAKNRVERSGAMSGRCRAGCRGAGTERGAG